MTVLGGFPCLYDGYRNEIIDGELLVSPTPSRKHQRVATRLILTLGNFLEADGAGEVYFAPVDVRLTPHDVVQPDLLFIRADRFEIYQAHGVVEGPPDFVVEIQSPANRMVDQVRKVRSMPGPEPRNTGSLIRTGWTSLPSGW